MNAKTTDLTQQRLDLAEMIDCPNEKLSPIKESNGYLYFFDTRNSTRTWTVKITATGRIKKNSLRIDNV